MKKLVDNDELKNIYGRIASIVANDPDIIAAEAKNAKKAKAKKKSGKKDGKP